MSKLPEWYDGLEEGIRDLVYLLRNNGFNTTSSCEHEMSVQIIGDADDVHPLWMLLTENNYKDFAIHFFWEQYPIDRRWIELYLKKRCEEMTEQNTSSNTSTSKAHRDVRPAPAETICIDLDGVLAEYHGWKKNGSIGPFLPEAKKLLQLIMAKGWRVVVQSARTNPDHGEEALEQIVLIKNWLRENKIDASLEVFGKPRAAIYIDDRAVSVKPNTFRAEMVFEKILEKIAERKQEEDERTW